MAILNNVVMLVGNLGDDPQMEYLPSGAAKVKMSVAVTRKWTNRDGTPQEATTWRNIVAWRDLAENIAESLRKGDRVIVIGEERQSSWDDQQSGQKRYFDFIEAQEVSPSLRWATAAVSKTPRNGSGPASTTRPAADNSGAPATDPFRADNPDDDDTPF